MQRSSLIVFVLMMTASVIRAEVVIPEKLSLPEAITLALTHNTGLKASYESQQASESRLKIESIDTTYGLGGTTAFDHNSTDSTVSGSLFGDISYRNASGMEVSVDLTPFGTGNNTAYMGLTVRQPLLRGRGALSRRADTLFSARSDVIIQDKNLYQSKQATVRDVVSTYFNAVLAREQVKVQERAVISAQEVADGTRKREEAGLVTGLDIGRAENRVTETLNALNRQRESARGAMDRLMLAIGAGVGHTPELTDMVPDVDYDAPDTDEAINTALENRTELDIFEERLATQQRRLDLAKDAYRPDLNAVARLRSTSDGSGFISDSFFSSGHANVGIEISYPLDKRVIQEERDITERRLTILEEQREFRKEEIAEQVRRALRSFESARNSLDIYGQNLDTAKERLHMAERMVEEGEGSNREVLEAQDSLTVVEIGLLSAKMNLYLATMDLKYAMGEDLSTMGTK